MEELEEKRERRFCSRLGWALAIVLVWSLVWQAGLYWLDSSVLPFYLPDTVYYLLSLIGHYAVSLPLAFALCRGIPKPPFCREAPGAGRMARWLACGIALMWAGSAVGDRISALAYTLAGREPVAVVDEAFSVLPLPAVLLGACALGPVCEELLFRGLLAGRLARYGQKPGAFVSALLFGLYHANPEQFFYAFALGILLAYAYYRTGLLRVPIALHILLNLAGAGLPSLLPGPIAAAGYGLVWLAASVWGVVLLVRGWEGQVWLHGPCAPSMRAVFGNAGMVCAILACMAETVYTFAF